MIEKERLEKLIEQGATIYEVKYGSINPVDLKNKIKLINYKYGMISFEPRKDEKYLSHKYFKNLFETKEEAEWQLEFGNITRTETLNLLTWEEFQKEGYCKFNSKDGRNLVIEYSVIFDFDSKNHKDYINILDTKDYDHNRIFVSDYTKDGYTLACRKAKELFLGENDGREENI